MANRCPGYMRHWFAVHQAVGMRSPYCVRCGAENPRPLTDEERAEFIYWMESEYGPAVSDRYTAWRSGQDV